MIKKQKVPERFWSIRQIDIFSDLSDADADALAQLTTFRHLENGELLCAEGVYLLKAGRVKIYEKPPEGEPVTREVLEPGEMFGAVKWEDNNTAHPNVIAEALTEVVVGVVNVKQFQFFLKRKPHVAMPPPKTLGRLLKIFLKALGAWIRPKLRRFNPPTSGSSSRPERTNLLRNIAFRSPASRLALLLLNYADAPEHNETLTGRGVQCTITKLSTRKLARLIGSSVERTEALLNQFKQHDILSKRFGRIRILDPWQLKKMANARMETLSHIRENNETYEQNEPLFAARPADGR